MDCNSKQENITFKTKKSESAFALDASQEVNIKVNCSLSGLDDCQTIFLCPASNVPFRTQLDKIELINKLFQLEYLVVQHITNSINRIYKYSLVEASLAKFEIKFNLW